LDDRNLDVLLYQVRHLARFLTYFDLSNQPSGTWEALFSPHFAVRLSTLAHSDSRMFRAQFEPLVIRVGFRAQCI
jgi:hypothetical protein